MYRHVIFFFSYLFISFFIIIGLIVSLNQNSHLFASEIVRQGFL